MAKKVGEPSKEQSLLATNALNILRSIFEIEIQIIDTLEFCTRNGRNNKSLENTDHRDACNHKAYLSDIKTIVECMKSNFTIFGTKEKYIDSYRLANPLPAEFVNSPSIFKALPEESYIEVVNSKGKHFLSFLANCLLDRFEESKLPDGMVAISQSDFSDLKALDQIIEWPEDGFPQLVRQYGYEMPDSENEYALRILYNKAYLQFWTEALHIRKEYQRTFSRILSSKEVVELDLLHQNIRITPRTKHVIKLVGQGLSRSEIAKRAGISVDNVSTIKYRYKEQKDDTD